MHSKFYSFDYPNLMTTGSNNQQFSKLILTKQLITPFLTMLLPSSPLLLKLNGSIRLQQIFVNFYPVKFGDRIEPGGGL